MSHRDDILKKLTAAEALPAGPAVMARITDLCRDPKTSARDLGKVMQLDPALTSRVLKQVNSSFYGLSATVKTVTHAVVILGFQEIKAIAMAVPVANLYEGSLDSDTLDISALWDRTLEVSCIARQLSYHIKYPVPEQVFVSGILCNTGIVILNDLLGDDYGMLVMDHPSEEDLARAEEEAFGITHVEVCQTLCNKWKFPPDLIQTITKTHDPFANGELLQEAALIYAARRLRGLFMAGSENEDAVAALREDIRDALLLTPDAAFNAYVKGKSDTASARQMLASD